jgi:plasmid maintenance system killer protein
MMEKNDQSWSSMEDLRVQLGMLGAMHPISRSAPRFRGRNTQATRLEPLGGAIVPIIDIQESGSTSPDEKLMPWREFSEWRNEISAEEEKRGIDALAWYVSFHNTEPEWGIYIPISSLHYIAGRHLKRLRYSKARKLEIAFNALLFHESIHYAVDRNVAAWELILGVALHGEVPDRLKTLGYIQVEEAVANAHKLRELKEIYSAACTNALGTWVSNSPAGYRDAFEYLDDADFRLGLEECVKTYAGEKWMANPDVGGGLGWIRWASQFIFNDAVDLTQCPIMVIDDQTGLGVLPTTVKYLQSIPAIVESRKFLKMLKRAPKQIQESWARKRETLKEVVPSHPEFEKLKGPLAGQFSLRVSDNYRAHLRPKATTDVWEALAIGPHTAMGHG